MKKILFIILIIFAPMSYAETTVCADKQTGGQIFNIKIDWDLKPHQLRSSVIVNGRHLWISSENVDGTGLLTTSYLDELSQEKRYAIFYMYNRTWIGQVRTDENDGGQFTGSVYPLSCSKSFIKPFLKHKYS